jgi:hypothetical protein
MCYGLRVTAIIEIWPAKMAGEEEEEEEKKR